MEWKKIKSTNPKAFSALVEWHKKEGEGMTTPLKAGSGELMFRHTFNPFTIVEVFSKRELYDFFDENGIYIEVYGSVHGFSFEISNGQSVIHEVLIVDDSKPDRKTAENWAFTKSFELLEQKLNNPATS